MAFVFPITPAVVIAIAPELADPGLSDEAWVDLLAFVMEFDLTAQQIGGTPADDRLFKIYLAAHFATMIALGASGAAGPVTSEAVGQIRISYGFSGGDLFLNLGLTPYGQQCISLLSFTFAMFPVVG